MVELIFNRIFRPKLMGMYLFGRKVLMYDQDDPLSRYWTAKIFVYSSLHVRFRELFSSNFK
jgi:hypothetical protein